MLLTYNTEPTEQKQIFNA